VIAISVGETDLTAQQFVRNFGLTYPVLRDPSEKVYSDYNITGTSPFPLDCIIDPQGIIRYLHTEYDPQYMMKTIEEILLTGIKTVGNENLPIRSFDMNIYPNPTNAQIKIEFNTYENEATVLKIFNVLGKQIFSREFGRRGTGKRTFFNVNLRDQPSGLYFVSISNGIDSEMKKLILLK
jgi:hypothetical protein